jgi:hypothetical protein
MKYINHIIKWSVPVLLVGYVLWQAMFATGSLMATTDFRERTPYFDVLLPAGRVELTADGIILKNEPVYIDVRLPVRAVSVSLAVKVSANSAPLQLGYQTSESFALVFSQSAPVSEQNYVLYHYDLTNISHVRSGHKVRFIISSPALLPGSILVKGASVSIKREPPTLNWWRGQLTKLWQS